MTTKLEALSKVNEEISNMQKKLSVRVNSTNGDFDFEIPDDETIWLQNDELGDGMYKKIKLHNYDNEILQLILYYGKKGAKIKKHQHKEPQLFICIEGLLRFIIDGNEYYVSKGESIFVESDQWHQFDFMELSKLIITYM